MNRQSMDKDCVVFYTAGLLYKENLFLYLCESYNLKLDKNILSKKHFAFLMKSIGPIHAKLSSFSLVGKL